MNKFFKILVLSIVAVMCLSIVSFAAEKNEGDIITLANAEGEDPLAGYNFSTSGAEPLQIVKDPLNPDNNVYYIKATVVDSKSWTYLWCKDIKFEAGQAYKIKFDVLLDKLATGEPAQPTSSCACFQYADTAKNEGAVKQNGTSGATASDKTWTTVSTEYYVPTTLDSSKTNTFGIYVNPIKECGTSFYLDNISVTPYKPGENDPDTLTIFCIGNSVLQHGINANLGWHGNWGMAASAPDKDYYSVMQKLFKEDFPDVKTEWHRTAAAGFERGITENVNEDYRELIMGAFGSKLMSTVPDIITLQFGENTHGASVTAESFAAAVEQCIDFCRSVNPDVKIILSTLAIGSENDKRSIGMKMAAANKGVPVVNLSQFNTPEHKALGLFEHSGVAGHPGDLGMQRIGETFYEVIKAYANGEEVEQELSIVINGKVMDYKTEPVKDGDTVYVSLKETAEALGCVVFKDATYNSSLRVCAGKLDVVVPAGEQYVLLNNDTILKLSAPTKANGDDILVPVDAFDAKVQA